MKFRSPLLLLIVALPLGLMAAEENPTATLPATPSPTPSEKSSKKPTATPAATPRVYPLRRWLRAWGIDKSSGKANMSVTGFKGLEIGLKVDPPQVVVGETKQIKVTVMLNNHGKKFVQLDFPTSQRIEVLVKSKEGKTVEQWSEDQVFNNEPTLVTVNPEERLEYEVKVSTRDMLVDQTYTIEAFFPNFDQLRKSMTVQAVKPPPATPAKSPTATPADGAATPEKSPSTKAMKPGR